MSLLDWSHAAADISSSGRRFKHEATEAERQAIARELGLIACTRLVAEYVVRPLGKGRYRLEGPCIADVTQACVVSLAPVMSTLVLPLDIDFAPELDVGVTASEEVEVLALPEVAEIENGRLPIGRVVFETLAAGIDPFPRAPDAAFSWRDQRDVDAKSHPFAVLHTLRSTDKDTKGS